MPQLQQVVRVRRLVRLPRDVNAGIHQFRYAQPWRIRNWKEEQPVAVNWTNYSINWANYLLQRVNHLRDKLGQFTAIISLLKKDKPYRFGLLQLTNVSLDALKDHYGNHPEIKSVTSASAYLNKTIKWKNLSTKFHKEREKLKGMKEPKWALDIYCSD